MRKISALLVTAGLAATLTGCATDPGYPTCGQYESGDASSIIDVSENFGAAPTVDFPTPIVPHNTEVTQVVQGDGDRISAGQPARIELSIFNGATGDELQSTEFDGNGILTMAGESRLPSVGKALECATVGSRIVVAATPKDAHNGAAIAELNVAADDSFIFVVDVLDAYLAKADGAPQSPNPGDPIVVTAPNGTPGITIPKSGASTVDPPEDLIVSTLQRGEGEEIEADSFAVLHYTGVLWDTNKVFDSTWTESEAAVFQLTENSVVKGFLDGLVGQKVGSQVLIVVPPELGYGDQGNGAVPPGATLVFVVDILGQITQD
ncbi:MAG: FKBP-type peptidyl-prolyl cis-trans isomerase [Homoserinimonas sp.]